MRSFFPSTTAQKPKTDEAAKTISEQIRYFNFSRFARPCQASFVYFAKYPIFLHNAVRFFAILTRADSPAKELIKVYAGDGKSMRREENRMGNGWVNLKGAPAGQRKNFPESVLAFCRTAFLGSFFKWGLGCSRAIIFVLQYNFSKGTNPGLPL